jgi:hypothetical protein
MADETSSNPLVEAAKAIGSTLGKVVATVTGTQAAAPATKEWSSLYIGSGTFIISKPKRSRRKRHQTNVHNPRPGMRK